MNNDGDKPVERNFNAANHSISDIKICAISPISGSNDSRKRHEKRLIFVGTAVSGTHIVIVQSLSISLSNGSSFEFVLRNSDTRNMSETVDKPPFGHYSLTQRLRNRVHFSIIEDVFDNPREVFSSEQGLCSLL